MGVKGLTHSNCQEIAWTVRLILKNIAANDIVCLLQRYLIPVVKKWHEMGDLS